MVAASLLVCALILEAGLRLFWDGYYQKFDPDRPWGEFTFHPTRGFGLVPGLEAVHWDADFKVLRRHNLHGFRGPEIAVAKPEGKTRVLVVGDSFVYGNGVENEETFCARLEALEPELQVINAGVPGYGGGETLVLLREEIGIWKPDVIIAGFFWNDVFDAYPGRYTRFELQDGALVEIAPEPPTAENAAFDPMRRRHARMVRRYGLIARESYLYRLVSDRYKVFSQGTRSLRRRFTGETDDGLPDGWDLSMYPEAWALAEALLAAQRDVARHANTPFALVVVPDSSLVEPGTVYGIPPHVNEVEERLAAFARREGVRTIDLHAPLQERRARDGRPLYFPADRHWNAEGHAHVAEILADELARLGWVRGA